MGIHNWEEHLHTSVEVPLHEVGAPQIDLGVATMVEVVDAVVFEEGADNTSYLDMLAKTG